MAGPRCGRRIPLDDQGRARAAAHFVFDCRPGGRGHGEACRSNVAALQPTGDSDPDDTLFREDAGRLIAVGSSRSGRRQAFKPHRPRTYSVICTLSLGLGPAVARQRQHGHSLNVSSSINTLTISLFPASRATFFTFFPATFLMRIDAPYLARTRTHSICPFDAARIRAV